MFRLLQQQSLHLKFAELCSQSFDLQFVRFLSATFVAVVAKVAHSPEGSRPSIMGSLHTTVRGHQTRFLTQKGKELLRANFFEIDRKTRQSRQTRLLSA